MAIVKITKYDANRGKQFVVTIPRSVAKDLPEEATHMIVEWTPDGILFRPIVLSPAQA